jgi:hypothetical protein
LLDELDAAGEADFDGLLKEALAWFKGMKLAYSAVALQQHSSPSPVSPNPALPELMVPQPIRAQPLALLDIQGTWHELTTNSVWTVDGIIAERPRRGQKSPSSRKVAVLTESPSGIEWGMGNLVGKLDAGALCWFNRKGFVAYRWVRPGANTASTSDSSRTSPTRTSTDSTPASRKCEPLSPSSSELNAVPLRPKTEPTLKCGDPLNPPAERTTLGHQAKLNEESKEDSMMEVALLLHIAGGRIAIGDYSKALHFVLLAQEICPATELKAMPEAERFIDAVISMAGKDPYDDRAADDSGWASRSQGFSFFSGDSGAERKGKSTALRCCGFLDQGPIWEPPGMSVLPTRGREASRPR